MVDIPDSCPATQIIWRKKPVEVLKFNIVKCKILLLENLAHAPVQDCDWLETRFAENYLCPFLGFHKGTGTSDILGEAQSARTLYRKNSLK